MEVINETIPLRVFLVGVTFPSPSDLCLPDFCLWGHLQSKVYINKSRTIDELNRNVQEMAGISKWTPGNFFKHESCGRQFDDKIDESWNRKVDWIFWCIRSTSTILEPLMNRIEMSKKWREFQNEPPEIFSNMNPWSTIWR